jgi:hypothetical protein
MDHTGETLFKFPSECWEPMNLRDFKRIGRKSEYNIFSMNIRYYSWEKGVAVASGNKEEVVAFLMV